MTSVESDRMHDDSWRKKFAGGLCAEFAVALHRSFGWPMVAFIEQEFDEDYDEWANVGYAHVVAIPSDGMAADSYGIIKMEDVDVASLAGRRVSAVQVSEVDLGEMSMEGLYEDEIDEAMEIVGSGAWP